MKLEDVMYSNADEVAAFIGSHTERRYEVGESFTLPDIGQTYVIEAVRPFRLEKRLYVYLDLAAACAVDGCGNPVRCSVDIGLWVRNRHLPRCCPSHRRGFRSPMPGAWWDLERREAELAKLDKRAAARSRKTALQAYRRANSRRGHVERAVLRAEGLLSVVSDRPTDAQLVAAAVPMLSRPAGRDTRKQKVVRAIAALRRRGLLFAPTGAT